MIYNKLGKNVLKTIAAVAAASVTYSASYESINWISKLEIVRKEMIKSIFTRNVAKLSLRKGSYVDNPALEKDIRSCIHDQPGGVKIIWAPPGTGKSTTVKHVLNAEIAYGKISGVLMLTPPRMTMNPDEWFRCELRYSGFETLTPYDHLSSLIVAPLDKPYVIVIDQCDNLDYDEKLRLFIKSIAEDSNIINNYVVIVICTDAAKAATMKKWNGGVKIRLINDEPIAYKWSDSQIEKWIEYNLKDHPTINSKINSVHFNKFKKAAVDAGTPDFLITNTSSNDIITNKKIDSWNQHSKYINNKWSSGQQLLSTSSTQSYWYQR
jgi:ABC-type iron transport system FetAB ATPase subunit